MQDEARQALLRIAKTSAVLPSDAGALRGILLDECQGESKSEIRALASVIEINFLPTIVSERTMGRTWADCSATLTRRFAQDSGLRDDLARWVVESWWMALAISPTPPLKGVNSPPSQSPTVPIRRGSKVSLLVAVVSFIVIIVAYFSFNSTAKKPVMPVSSSQSNPTPPVASVPPAIVAPKAPPTESLKPLPTRPTDQITSEAKLTPPKKESAIIINSLGQRLIQINPTCWMTATLVRKKEYAAFVAATNTSSGNTIVSVRKDGWEEITGSWKNPGFQQSDDDPAVGVSWDDAQAFCRWLTQTERDSKRLSSNQRYRLPTEADWLAAAKSQGTYPWGNSWPPPLGAGNFAGQEVLVAGVLWPEDWSAIEGFTDGQIHTSPVGAFGTNSLGFADIAGNVLQWCEDYYSEGSPNRVLRGSSWADYQPSHLRTDSRQGDPPDFKATTIGFRIALSTDLDVKQN